MQRYFNIDNSHPFNALLLQHAHNNRMNGVASPGVDHEPIMSPPQPKPMVTGPIQILPPVSVTDSGKPSFTGRFFSQRKAY